MQLCCQIVETDPISIWLNREPNYKLRPYYFKSGSHAPFNICPETVLQSGADFFDI